MSNVQSIAARSIETAVVRGQQAYVIEIGETQAGLVNRRGEERFFTFISACSAFHALEGQRFATPYAAERAARIMARSNGAKAAS